MPPWLPLLSSLMLVWVDHRDAGSSAKGPATLSAHTRIYASRGKEWRSEGETSDILTVGSNGELTDVSSGTVTGVVVQIEKPEDQDRARSLVGCVTWILAEFPEASPAATAPCRASS